VNVTTLSMFKGVRMFDGSVVRGLSNVVELPNRRTSERPNAFVPNGLMARE
jgi:hypothetical protein